METGSRKLLSSYSDASFGESDDDFSLWLIKVVRLSFGLCCRVYSDIKFRTDLAGGKRNQYAFVFISYKNVSASDCVIYKIFITRCLKPQEFIFVFCKTNSDMIEMSKREYVELLCFFDINKKNAKGL